MRKNTEIKSEQYKRTFLTAVL